MDMIYDFPTFRALLPHCRLTIYSHGDSPFWREVLSKQDVWVHLEGDDPSLGSYEGSIEEPFTTCNEILCPENQFESRVKTLMEDINPSEILCWNLPTKIEKADDSPLICWEFICLRNAK